LLDKIKKAKQNVKIGLVGKYVGNSDAYLSVTEALKSACYHQGAILNTIWIDADKLEKDNKAEIKKLSQVDGLLVPGGFGKRGIEGKIMAAKYAREKQKPYFGLCLGAQILAIEFARNVAGLKDSNSEEFNPKAEYQIVHFLPGQSEHLAKGGTLRLGAYPCHIKRSTLAFKAYETDKISERHRHRYEFNNAYRKQLEDAGLLVAGVNPQSDLVEIVEVPQNKFHVGVQFHPEFKSRPLSPHPLFVKFIEKAIE
jgi:CTP synthase